MEKNSLINEAHLLERKSEECGRRGLFDEALQNCIAASDCLSRLLTGHDQSESTHADSSNFTYQLLSNEVKESIQTQLAQLERRKKSTMKKKHQFEYLKNLLAQQQQLQQQRKEASEAEGEKLRRGSSASSIKRRSSTKENRRRSGVVEASAEPPFTPPSAMNQQNARLASILDASPDSYSLLTTYLDGRANEPGYEVASGQTPITSNEDVNSMEKLRIQNAHLQEHVTSLLQKVERERSKSAALEASLYEMSLNPKGPERERIKTHRLNVNTFSSSEVDEDELTVKHPAEFFRLNRLPLDLPPLDIPPIDIPPSDLYNLPP